MSVKEDYTRIQNADKIIIYGTGIMANAFYELMKSQIRIRCFMVSGSPQNDILYDQYEVISVVDAPELYKDDLVVVAVIDKYLSDINKLLLKCGFKKILPITFESELWQYIREPYIQNIIEQYRMVYRRIGEEFVNKDRELVDDIKIYQVKCHLDTEIAGLEKYGYEVPIQAGTSLTDISVAEIQDNIGDNISKKNKQYCELTAWYWIWKNTESDYVGVCHYRRHFKVKVEILNKLGEKGVDVVLPVPILNLPNVRTMYEHDHVIADWDTMMEAIEKFQPEYLCSAHRIENGQFYFGYNMIFARKAIFDDYCEWLFPILFYCENKCAQRHEGYQNRYVGFLAERLLTIYFMHNWEKYNIVIADKEFLQKE